MKVLNRSEQIIAPRTGWLFRVLDLYMLDSKIIWDFIYKIECKIIRCIL